MGFRFRRSLKLFPGLRLNVGLGGLSLSAGRPGAMFNFSSRGAKATFGIPGTGFAWSTTSGGGIPSRYRQPSTGGVAVSTIAELEAALQQPGARIVNANTGRRMSPQQIDALYRRLEKEERREQALAEVAKLEEDLAEQMACWRDMPSVLSMRSCREALKAQPFKFDRSIPSPPDFAVERENVKARTAAIVESNTPSASILGPAVAGMTGLSIGVVVASLAAAKRPVVPIDPGILMLTAMSSVAAGLIAAGVLHWRSSQLRRRLVVEGVEARLQEEWAMQERELRLRHEAATARYRDDRERAEAAWSKREGERVRWVQRLMDGDVEAIEAAVTDSLQDLDFPFEATAEFALNGSTEGYLHIDLPEIEDVIPMVRHQVLSDGRIKEVKRTEVDRHTDYVELSCGVGLLMAATTFSAAPTMDRVHIAAYTQREKKGRKKGQIADDYVYVVTLSRQPFMTMSARTVDATATLRAAGMMEQAANRSFKALPTKSLPAWVGEFSGG